jgi:outer membrane cobalamin receptor
VMKPRDGTTLKLLYGQAYLAPTPYQSYAHYGSFYSTDGGGTYASDYWHVPNPRLKPQRKRTVEGTVLQQLAPSLNLSASAFVSTITNLIKTADPDRSYAGTYLGWPVAYIDFAVNEGHQRSYGGTVGVDFLKSWASDRSLSARFGLSLANGTIWDDGEAPEPIGAMAPVQFRAGTDADLGRWTAALRVVGVGRQRLLAMTMIDGKIARQSLDGYTTIDLNLRRRHLFKNVDGFVTIENLGDARYRHINARAYTNPEELIGAPQNPRRITVGFSFRLR